MSDLVAGLNPQLNCFPSVSAGRWAFGGASAAWAVGTASSSQEALATDAMCRFLLKCQSFGPLIASRSQAYCCSTCSLDLWLQKCAEAGEMESTHGRRVAHCLVALGASELHFCCEICSLLLMPYEPDDSATFCWWDGRQGCPRLVRLSWIQRWPDSSCSFDRSTAATFLGETQALPDFQNSLLTRWFLGMPPIFNHHLQFKALVHFRLLVWHLCLLQQLATTLTLPLAAQFSWWRIALGFAQLANELLP